MRRRVCVYQQTNQNIAPVIKNFQNSERSRTESDIVSRLRHIFRTFHESIHNFFKWTVYRKPYWTYLVKYSAHFCGLFLLLNNAMHRRDFRRFLRQVNKHLLFFRFTDFLRSSRYFSSIVKSIKFYHVDCGDGRQLRILVDNFLIPRSKTRTFSISHRAVLLLFFALVRAFAFFLSKAKTTLLVMGLGDI